MIFNNKDKLFLGKNGIFFTYLKTTLFFEILHYNSVKMSILNQNFYITYDQNDNIYLNTRLYLNEDCISLKSR